MKKSFVFTALFVAVASMPASATIINVPADQPNIQAGINASTNGDTVRVAPGTYVENINFSGKNIVVGSWFLDDDDTSFISSTIIDGNQAGSVVTFENGEDNTAVITGFTIQNGKSYDGGGGIYCQNSSPSIISNHIIGNEARTASAGGGGIYCLYSDAFISGNTIRGNFAYGMLAVGGGIACDESSPVISGNIISDNYINGDEYAIGGGISCRNNSNPTIINNLIVSNEVFVFAWPPGHGGGIYYDESSPAIVNNTITGNNPGGICRGTTDAIVMNNIIWANAYYEIDSFSTAAVTYCDVRGGWEGEGNIDSNPLFIDPDNDNYNICLQSPCINAGDPDILDPDGNSSYIGEFYYDHPDCSIGNRWYVSTTGDDVSGDGSEDFPFLTIQHAINISLHGDTIIVQNGIYEENIRINAKDIVLTSNYMFSGNMDDIRNTIIDGDSAGTVVYLEYCGDATTIMGLTIRNGYNFYVGGGIYCFNSNPVISRNIITQNMSGFYGGGIYCSYSGPIISYNIISENLTAYGGGISCSYSNASIIGNIISENIAESPYDNAGGGGIIVEFSDATITGNTIYGNSAELKGGGILCYYSSPIVANSIFWDNYAPDGAEIYLSPDASPLITFCDIQGGWSGEGNIDCDPQFCYADTGNYYLHSNSCCIGAGEGGVDIGALGAGCGPCLYTPGDCNHNAVPLELGDVMAMIAMYRGSVDPYYICDCGVDPPGAEFAATADPNGNCIPFELGDVVTEIAAYRGSVTASGCEDCPGSRRLLPGDDEDRPLVMPSLKAKAVGKASQ